MIKEMTIHELIVKLEEKKDELEITFYPAASEKQIKTFEQELNLRLPDEIKQFYRFYNGFETAEVLFRIIPLDEILDNRKDFESNHFFIAEYLIYCDIWEIHLNADVKKRYEIFNNDVDSQKVVLTDSFTEFVNRFLDKGIYEEGGLYHWKEQKKE